MAYTAALPAIAAVLGAASGACLGWAGARSVRRARAARARAPDGGQGQGGAQAGACLSYLEGLSRRLALRATRPMLPVGALRRAHARFEEQVGKAGLSGTCQPRRAARVRCALPRRVRRRGRCWAARHRTSLRRSVAWRAA